MIEVVQSILQRPSPAFFVTTQSKTSNSNEKDKIFVSARSSAIRATQSPGKITPSPTIVPKKRKKKKAKSLANSGQLLENSKSFSGCIVSGFSSVSLESPERFYVTIFVAISHLQRTFQKFDVCLLPSKDRVKLQAGYEGRKERGRWEEGEFYSGG